jgi:fatty-acyl-CoA synthase
MNAPATLVEMLELSAARYPERALNFRGHERISFAELARESRVFAAALRTRGVGRGSCVGLLLPTGRDFVVSFFGILQSGAAVAPLALPRGFAEAANLCERLRRLAGGVTLAVVDPVFAERLREQAFEAFPLLTPAQESVASASLGATVPKPRAEDLAVVQYTSGSTSQPRGVALRHRNVIAGCRAIAQAMALTEHDTLGAWLPLFHDMGLVSLLVGIMAGVEQHHTSPAAFIKDPGAWLKAFSDRKNTVYAGPNFSYEQMLTRISDAELADLDLSAWRVAFNGGEPIAATCMTAFIARFEKGGFRASSMLPCYGLAEATLAVTFDALAEPPHVDWVERARLSKDGVAAPHEASAPGERRGVVSTGRVVPGMELEIRDERGEICEERRVGEIHIRGEAVCEEYYRDAAGSAEQLTGGWLKTGDLGYLAAGRLFVTGRRKQLLIVRGANYYPEDIEAAIRTTPGVYQRRCVALKLEDDGESVCLLVEAHTRAEAGALAARVRAAAEHGFPELAFDVRVVPARTLRQTSSGKYQRLLMRDLLRSGVLSVLAAAKPSYSAIGSAHAEPLSGS